MCQLFNMMNDRNEKTLPNQLLTIHDISSNINKTQESWCLESFNQDSISSHLDQYQTFDKLTSYYFNKIELEHECNTDPQFCDLIPIFESLLTPIFLSDLNHISEQTLIHVSYKTWTWITNLAKSHSIDGEWMWTSTL